MSNSRIRKERNRGKSWRKIRIRSEIKIKSKSERRRRQRWWVGIWSSGKIFLEGSSEIL
mgnify:CR=1 FL=1